MGISDWSSGVSAADPFIHYLEAGRTEGRSGRNELGWRYETNRRLEPLDARVVAVARASARVKAGTAAALAQALAGGRTNLCDLHITFSHDDYTTNTGGVQLCRSEEHTSEIQSLMRITYAVLYLQKKQQLQNIYRHSSHKTTRDITI